MVVKDRGRKKIEAITSKLETLSIEYAPIGSISANSYNPNRQSDHDFELLKRSMETDGFTQPILCLRDTRVIVDGYHRWKAAEDLGYTEVPVVFVDMTPNQARVSTLRHNRARGSEDIELVAAMLRDLEQLGEIKWAQDELMLDDIEIQRLLEDVSAPDALAAEQFSGAWEPEGTHHATTEGHEREIGGAPAYEGISSQASDRMRAGEKALAEAKSDEERQAALKDRAIYRIALTFSDEEAQIVKKALGDRPAETLLEMCKAKLA